LNEVGNATGDLGYGELWCIPVNVTNPHHSSRLGGHFIVWVERVNSPLCDPLIWIDVLVIELEVMSLPRLVLLKDARLCPFDAFCGNVITAAFDVPERPVHIRPDLGHVADVQLVMKESLRLSNICLRLQ
jgi:hypothetical protein